MSRLVRQALPTAVCADGSSGYVYTAANTSSNDVVIHLQGGRGCAHDYAQCEAVPENDSIHSTSDNLPDTAFAYGLLSGDPAVNPLYSDYNRVYVPYCSMDMFLLSSVAVGDDDLRFQGRHFLEEALSVVLTVDVAGDARVVLSGSSAGGIGALNIASWLLDTFDQVTELSVVLDSTASFSEGESGSSWLTFLSEESSGAYSDICSEEFEGAPCCLQVDCMIERGYYPIDDERLQGTFLLSNVQSNLEASGIDHATAYGDVHPLVLWEAGSRFGERSSSIRNLASVYPEAISVFAPSCADQDALVASELDMFQCFLTNEDQDDNDLTCDYGDSGQVSSMVRHGAWDIGLSWTISRSASAWDDLQIKGTSVRDALELWAGGRGNNNSQVALYDSCEGINCNPSCGTEVFPGTRTEIEGSFVWAISGVVSAVAAAVLVGGAFLLLWGWLHWRRAKTIVRSRARGRSTHPPKPGLNASSSIRNIVALQSSSNMPSDQSSKCSLDAKESPLLEWTALSYWSPRSKCLAFPTGGEKPFDEEDQILLASTGVVPANALCAVMGVDTKGTNSSDALVGALSGRNTGGRYAGDITFEGASVAGHEESYIRKAGDVRRREAGIVDTLSVLDNLLFAAMLRVPGELDEQITRVETALSMVALQDYRDTKGCHLAPGQRRRLALASELLLDRRILFVPNCDDGLDSMELLDVMTILKRVSRKVSVVVGIEHPTPEAWQFFSHVVLMKDSWTVYSGPAQGAAEAITRCIPVASTSKLPDMKADLQRDRLNTATTSGTLAHAGSTLHAAEYTSDFASTVDAAALSSDPHEPALDPLGNFASERRSLPATAARKLSGLRQGVTGLGSPYNGGKGSASTPSRPTRVTPSSEPRSRRHRPRRPNTPMRGKAGSSALASARSSAFGAPATATTPTSLATGCATNHRHSFSAAESIASTLVNAAAVAPMPAAGRAATAAAAAAAAAGEGSHEDGDAEGESESVRPCSSFSPCFSEFDSIALIPENSEKRARAGARSSDALKAARELERASSRQALTRRDSRARAGGRRRGDASSSQAGGVPRGRGGRFSIGMTQAELAALGHHSVGLHMSDVDDMPPATAASRSVPDSILDALAMLDRAALSTLAGEGPSRDRTRRAPTGTTKTVPSVPQSSEGQDIREAMQRALRDEEEGGGDVEQPAAKAASALGPCPRTHPCRKTPTWKVAALLLARSGRSGYAREIAWRFVLLELTVAITSAAFRAASPEWTSLRLMLSVLATLSLPMLLLYRPLVMPRVREDWTLVRLEAVDGFYSSWCGALRLAVDHLTLGVVGSLATVVIVHAILWHPVIAELPDSTYKVTVQLSCAVTLLAWTVIGLLDAAILTGVHYTRVAAAAASLSTIWVASTIAVFLAPGTPFLETISYTSPHYWSSSFMLRTLLDGLDMTDFCDFDSPILCLSRYGDVLADELGLRIRSAGTLVLVLTLFACASLSCLAIVIGAKTRQERALSGLGCPRSISLLEPRALSGAEDYHGNHRVCVDEPAAVAGRLSGPAKMASETKAKQRAAAATGAANKWDTRRKTLLQRIGWRGVGEDPVSHQFPGSDMSSSSSFSFKSFSPPFSSTYSPDDGTSPVPLPPGTTATRITADALARFEEATSPAWFDRGVGGWMSSRNGLFVGGAGAEAGPATPAAAAHVARSAHSSPAAQRSPSAAIRPASALGTMSFARAPSKRRPALASQPSARLTGASTAPAVTTAAAGRAEAASSSAKTRSLPGKQVFPPLLPSPTLAMAGMGARARMFAATRSLSGGRQGAQGGGGPPSSPFHESRNRGLQSGAPPRAPPSPNVSKGASKKERQHGTPPRLEDKQHEVQIDVVGLLPPWTPGRNAEAGARFTPLLPLSHPLLSVPEQRELPARTRQEGGQRPPRIRHQRSEVERVAGDAQPIFASDSVCEENESKVGGKPPPGRSAPAKRRLSVSGGSAREGSAPGLYDIDLDEDSCTE